MANALANPTSWSLVRMLTSGDRYGGGLGGIFAPTECVLVIPSAIVFARIGSKVEVSAVALVTAFAMAAASLGPWGLGVARTAMPKRV